MLIFSGVYFNLFKFNKGNKDRQDQIIMIKPFPGELTKWSLYFSSFSNDLKIESGAKQNYTAQF